MKTVFVLFGATGDLAKRKLIPAFYCMDKDKQLNDFHVIGVGRKEKTTKEFQTDIKRSLTEFASCGSKDASVFANTFSYRTLHYSNKIDYLKLKEDILSQCTDTCQIIYYLAVPPSVFGDILQGIKSIGFNLDKTIDEKVVFEKPFGSDLKSARELNKKVMNVFREDQVYRIDHYLGKEAVQNFLVMRFANHFLEPLWNNRHIDNIQITASESIGVENRGGYYDESGALRDMVQNHLFQMLSLIAMEPPIDLSADAIRDEKVKIFSAIKNIESNWEKSVVFGQYDSGTIDSKKINAYREEEGVNPKSKTETFVALKLQIDNWRWAGVPFYLRTGKRLKGKGTSVVVEFRKLPSILYNEKGTLESNKLIIKIQPDESIKMQFNIKAPGDKLQINPIEAEFDSKTFFKGNSPEAYERLLLNVVKGDQTLFTRWDGVEESWKIVDKLVNCREHCPMIHKYKPGSWGPAVADMLLNEQDHTWHNV